MKTTDSQKPYTLAFEVREKYLYAFVSGDADNYEISVAYWSEIADKMEEIGMDKLLVVEDLDGQAAMVDVYNVSAAIIEMGFRGKIVAFVDRHASHHELNEFGAVVTSNRGMIGEVFLSEDEAEHWLLAR